MADITITVSIQSIFKEVARRSSMTTETDPFYADKTTEDKQYSQLHGEGDRITSDFTKEAAKEVLKAYLSRQGDVTGVAYEYDKVENVTVTPVKQVETVTLTGDSGIAHMTEAGGLDIAFSYVSPDLAAVAAAFVTDNEAAYMAEGIVITNDGDTIIFEADVAGVPFDAPVVVPGVGTLHGTTEHTVANVTGGIIGVPTGNIVYRFSENSVPLSAKQTASIVERLTNNTHDAIMYYVLVSLYRTDGNQKKEVEVLNKAISLIDELSGDLYRLHD